MEDARNASNRFAFFTSKGAPLLEETGMMDTPVYPNSVSAPSANPPSRSDATMTAQRVTVPFREDGDGFSLVSVEFGPGYLLPRHSHSSDCLYYVVEGQAIMGTRVLEAGEGFFLPKDFPYAYKAGPEGVKILEIRHQTSFDMQILEKDMVKWRDKAEASLASATAATSPV